jgi:hypothetical protein
MNSWSIKNTEEHVPADDVDAVDGKMEFQHSL